MKKLFFAAFCLLCTGCFWGCSDEPSEPWYPDFESIVTADYFTVTPQPLQIEDGKITLTVSGDISDVPTAFLKTLVADVRVGLGYPSGMVWHDDTDSFRGANAQGECPLFPSDGLLSLEKTFTAVELPVEVWVDLAFHYQGRETKFKLRIDDDRP